MLKMIHERRYVLYFSQEQMRAGDIPLPPVRYLFTFIDDF